MSGLAYGLVGDGVKQAFLEAETAVNTYAPPDLIKYHPGVAKFWISYFHSTGTPTSNANYNVASLGDTGPGNVLLTVTSEFTSTEWALVRGGVGGYKSGAVNSDTQACGSIQLGTWDDAASPARADVNADNAFAAGFGVQVT